MTELTVLIGKNIRERRIAKGWTQEYLADLMSETPITISRWETAARRVSMEDIHKLSGAFNCNVDELLYPPTPVSASHEKLMKITAQLSSDDVEELLLLARHKISKRKRQTL